MDRLDPTNNVVTSTFTTDKCLKSLLSFHKKGAGGQTTVEFAIICVPFFVILFGIIDFAQLYFYENSLQNALREACRFATAGRIIQATNADGSLAYETNSAGIAVPKAINDSSGQEASRNECIRYWFYSNCIFQNIPLGSIVITSAPTLPGVPPNVITNTTAGDPAYGDLTLVSGYNVTTNSGNVSTNTVAAIKGPGNANDYAQITVSYQLSTITPLLHLFGWTRGGSNSTIVPVRVSAIIKNEPALLNFQHTAIYTNEP
jgi:hypothetical protein